MQRILCSTLFIWLAIAPLSALHKPHVISFGRWQIVRRFADTSAPSMTYPQSLPLADAKVDTKGDAFKIRPLFVDAQLRENTTGLPHEITDRIFAVQHAIALTIAFPWKKPRVHVGAGSLAAGWKSIELRRVSALNLPEFGRRPRLLPGVANMRILRRIGRREETACQRGRSGTPQADCEGTHGRCR